MEGLVCHSSLQASLSVAAGSSSIARRSTSIAFRLPPKCRRIVFEQRRGLGIRACAGAESESTGASEDRTNRFVTENKSSSSAKQRTEFFGVDWSRLQVLGWLTLVAFGIGASAASASVNPSRRYAPPCFASVSSSSSTDQDKETTDSSKEEQQPVETKEEIATTEVKKAEIVNAGDDEVSDDEDDLAEDDEFEDQESDVEDEEGNNYPTIGDLEDMDELGELASGAAAAELLSGSGEIESAEAEGERGVGGDTEDEDLKKAFEEWKSKPYALTVPLRLVGLRGSVPPAWLKEFMMSQGKNAKVSAEFKGSLSDILADLAVSMENQHITPKSTMAADLVTVGDSWLAAAVMGGLVEPIKNAEQFEWFNRLHPRWQSFIRRNAEGAMDPEGAVWGVPYRWGSLVFAYRKDKLEKNGVEPIKDWKDLFQPSLAGRVAMVDNPREVVGAVLKSLGGTYNTSDFDAEIPGGREAVKQRFVALQRQVRLFDDNDYLKAMGAGDVWVAVGWSSDIIPYSKRASNISVFAPASGTSLWADLWAIPAATVFQQSENIGGRVRGPSPLVFQWLDFCLQPARAVTFANDVFVGASPLAWSEKTGESVEPSAASKEEKAKPVVNIDTNIVQGMPPEDIVAKSEFLEPLTDIGVDNYKWLLSEPVDSTGWPRTISEFLKGIVESFRFRNPQGSRS